jgi:non-ribosomal peptide synthetase component F
VYAPRFEARGSPRLAVTQVREYEAQREQFHRLAEELAPGRGRSHAPLVQVAFAFQDAPARGFRLGAAAARPLWVDLGTAQLDLTFLLDGHDDGVSGVLEYATDLFSAATAERIATCLRLLLEAAVATPGTRLSRLPLLRPGERETLVGEWSGAGERFPVSGALHHRFEARAAARPDAFAVSYEGESLTYGELNARANRLARRRRALGAGPESRVGLCGERSLALVAGVLAIVKAGAAYVRWTQRIRPGGWPTWRKIRGLAPPLPSRRCATAFRWRGSRSSRWTTSPPQNSRTTWTSKCRPTISRTSSTRPAPRAAPRAWG